MTQVTEINVCDHMECRPSVLDAIKEEPYLIVKSPVDGKVVFSVPCPGNQNNPTKGAYARFADGDKVELHCLPPRLRERYSLPTGDGPVAATYRVALREGAVLWHSFLVRGAIIQPELLADIDVSVSLMETAEEKASRL